MAELSLLTYWKESLAPFTKGNLKLYLLGTLATFMRSFTTLIRNFWWLILSGLGLVMLAFYFFKGHEGTTSIAAFIIGLLVFIKIIMIAFTLWFLILLSTRPSLEAKNRDYFRRYAKKWWVLLLLLFFIPGNNLMGLIAAPFVTILMLFYLDSDLSLDAFAASFIRSTKAITYFLPAFLCIGLVTLVLILLLIGADTLTLKLVHLLSSSALLTLACRLTVAATLILCEGIFTIAALTVYYVKMKHEHHDLFFE